MYLEGDPEKELEGNPEKEPKKEPKKEPEGEPEREPEGEPGGEPEGELEGELEGEPEGVTSVMTFEPDGVIDIFFYRYMLLDPIEEANIPSPPGYRIHRASPVLPIPLSLFSDSSFSGLSFSDSSSSDSSSSDSLIISSESEKVFSLKCSPVLSALSSGDEIEDDVSGYEPHLTWVSRDTSPCNRIEKGESGMRSDPPEISNADAAATKSPDMPGPIVSDSDEYKLSEDRLRMRMKFISELKVGDKIIVEDGMFQLDSSFLLIRPFVRRIYGHSRYQMFDICERDLEDVRHKRPVWCTDEMIRDISHGFEILSDTYKGENRINAMREKYMSMVTSHP